MSRGRRPGQREISLKQIGKIISMTMEKKYSRPEIAKEAGVSKDTVWRYQKMYGLI